MDHQQILPTPNIAPQQGVFTFYAVAEIEASPEEVWNVISNFSTYPSWNEYTPSIVKEYGPDQTPSSCSSSLSDLPKTDEWYTLHYKLDRNDKPQAMKMKIITSDSENMTLCWQGRFMPTFLLNAEKVQKVTKIQSDGQVGAAVRTKYEIWETQAGPMAHIVKWAMQPKLQKMNEGIAQNLKNYLERQVETSM